MKQLTVDYANHMASGVTTTAVALKVVRKDGLVLAATSHVRDIEVLGTVYSASPGLNASNIDTASGAQVGNLEITTIHDEEVFKSIDILSGRWKNASFQLFRFNYAAPTQGVEWLLVGNVGEILINDIALTVELRDLRQYLQQDVGSQSSPNCRYRYGSTDKNNGGICMQDLTSVTFAGSVTSVSNRQLFTDSGQAGAPDDYYGEGDFVWTSGANAGLSARIMGFTAGLFYLALPMLANIQVGDTYIAVQGCRRTRQACKDRGNILNFGGEPDRPTIDQLTQPVDQTV